MTWINTQSGWVDPEKSLGCIDMNKMLVRYVELPLRTVDKVDADMLFQEIAVNSDISRNDWWLSWDFNECADGVAGLVFGLHESVRKDMMSDEQWKDTKFISIALYERLNAYKHSGVSSIVIDQDKEGLCFGFYNGETWCGMRYLREPFGKMFLQELCHTLLAMGFDNGGVGHGRISDVLLDKVSAYFPMEWEGEILSEAELPSAHNAYLKRQEHGEPVFNIRHGSWAAPNGWKKSKLWRLMVEITCVLLFSWVIAMSYDSYRLNSEANVDRLRVEAAFHNGLPNESAMIDPIAQLKRAASYSPQKHDSVILSSLKAISQAYNKVAWKLTDIELRSGTLYINGSTANIESLNIIQSSLAKDLVKDVQIIDTNITGGKVNFKLKWK